MVPLETKLLFLLSGRQVTFFIPPYQRNYEWTEEQCKVFLDDVIKTRDANVAQKNTEHFFGSVTYFESEKSVFGEPSRLILIDGQQRITTTMLFLAAVRDLLKDPSKKETINNDYLKNERVKGTLEYKVKLKQVESDWECYKNIVLGETINEEDRNCAVYKNYSGFKNKLEKLASDGQGNVLDEVLISYVKDGLQNFRIVTLELKPYQNKWENPQEIFESMNSIGKPLSLADLVRNYLLLGLDADKQDDLYHRYWLKIEKTVPGMISTFIRDYMQGIEERPFKQAREANYKELYSQFKDVFAGCDAEELLQSLKKYAATYAYIAKGITTGNAKVDSVLNDLRSVNVTVAYSFLMMLIQTWVDGTLNTEDLIDSLEAIKVYCYRRRILGITQAENKSFPLLVKQIPVILTATDKKAKTFEILASQENNMRLPNDLELTRFLETMNFYNFKYCKLFLAMVEEKITKSRPVLTDKILQVEHIMPQTLNQEWQHELGSDYNRVHQDYVNQIGNLTLIRHNQELGNKDFSTKKDVYSNKAGLQIAKTNITDCEKWNEASIKARADWMIKTMLEEIFPVPEEMKMRNNYVSRK